MLLAARAPCQHNPVEYFTHPAVVPILGFLVGLVGAVVGVGGGFFIVPYLLFARTGVPMEATGTSLVLVTLNAVSATIRNARQKQILWRLGSIMGIATLPGAFLGTELIRGMNVGLFQICFGILLAGSAAYALIISAAKIPEDPSRMRIHMGAAVLVSLATGFVSSMFGVGGGVIHVPLMMFAFLVPGRMSTSTSQFAMLYAVVLGAAVFAFRGTVLWDMVLLMAPGVVIGAQIGAWATSKVKGSIIRRAFAAICLVVSIQMILKGWGSA